MCLWASNNAPLVSVVKVQTTACTLIWLFFTRSVRGSQCLTVWKFILFWGKVWAPSESPLSWSHLDGKQRENQNEFQRSFLFPSASLSLFLSISLFSSVDWTEEGVGLWCFPCGPYISPSPLMLYGIQSLFIPSMCSLCARALTSDPKALDSVISGPRETVCVCGYVLVGGVDRGLIIAWPHSLSLHRLTPRLHFTGYKTHILAQRHTQKVEWFNCQPFHGYCMSPSLHLLSSSLDHRCCSPTHSAKVKDNLCSCRVIRISSKIKLVLPRPMLHHSTKFHENWASSCCFFLVLLTDKQTHQQTRLKHDLLGGGEKEKKRMFKPN